jgi:HlyD family secretion protein
MLSKFGLPLLAAGLLAFAVTHVIGMQRTPPKLEPMVPPARSPFGATVAGAGLVEARSENIYIGSAVAGVVQEVQITVGKKVRQGDPLFTVDNRHLKAQLKAREAELAAAQTQLAKLQAQPRSEELPVKEARYREAEANLSDQEVMWNRAKTLYETGGRSGAITEEEYIRRRQAYSMAQQQSAAAKADFELLKAGAWKLDKDIAQAAITQAEAQLGMVKTEIERTIVRASVDGEVLQMNVRPGEYVGSTPGQVYVVLGDVSKLHIRVDIDEHDLPRFRPGSQARANPRGDAKQVHQLSFVRVEPLVVPKRALTGNTGERVDTRVLQVIFAVDRSPSDARLYVGQQVDVFIDAKPEERSQESGVRSQESGVRSQESGVRSQESE